MTLSELIERVEKLDGPDEAVDAEICVALQYGGKNSEHAANVRTDPDWSGDLLFEIGNMDCCNPVPELTASLDAAIALTERVLPGWAWRVATCCVSDDAWLIPDFNHPIHGKRLMREFGQVDGDPTTHWQEITDVDLRPSGRPAIAMCLSLLRALSAQERDDGR